MKTVGELRAFLQTTEISPETLAKKTGVSNMTLRRLLRQSDDAEISLKFQLLLERGINPPAASEEKSEATAAGQGEVFQQLVQDSLAQQKNLIDQLLSEGKKFRGEGTLKQDLEKKKEGMLVPQSFHKQIVTLYEFAMKSGGRRTRWHYLAIGALVYFLNPFDFIPDALGPIGYVDDLAVIALTLDALKKSFQI